MAILEWLPHNFRQSTNAGGDLTVIKSRPKKVKRGPLNKPPDGRLLLRGPSFRCSRHRVGTPGFNPGFSQTSHPNPGSTAISKFTLKYKLMRDQCFVKLPANNSSLPNEFGPNTTGTQYITSKINYQHHLRLRSTE